MLRHEFLPHGSTINKEYYLEVMRQLCEAVHQKCTELWKNQSWILPYDNAPAHSARLVDEFLVKNKTVIICEPLYSPDLAPTEFFLLLKLKTPTKRKSFATIEEIKEKSAMSCWRYQKAHLGSVLRIGKNPFLSVWYLKGVEGDKMVIDK